jgi:hypothetical protein
MPICGFGRTLARRMPPPGGTPALSYHVAAVSRPLQRTRANFWRTNYRQDSWEIVLARRALSLVVMSLGARKFMRNW